MITTLKELNPQITDNAFINCDCMEGLKKFPDNYFDLAVVDPPYGDGGVTSREIQGLVDGSTAINRGGGKTAAVPWWESLEQVPQGTVNTKIAESRTEHGVTRTGGTWAEKYRKKS